MHQTEKEFNESIVIGSTAAIRRTIGLLGALICDLGREPTFKKFSLQWSDCFGEKLISEIKIAGASEMEYEVTSLLLADLPKVADDILQSADVEPLLASKDEIILLGGASAFTKLAICFNVDIKPLDGGASIAHMGDLLVCDPAGDVVKSIPVLVNPLFGEDTPIYILEKGWLTVASNRIVTLQETSPTSMDILTDVDPTTDKNRVVAFELADWRAALDEVQNIIDAK